MMMMMVMMVMMMMMMVAREHRQPHLYALLISTVACHSPNTCSRLRLSISTLGAGRASMMYVGGGGSIDDVC